MIMTIIFAALAVVGAGIGYAIDGNPWRGIVIGAFAAGIGLPVLAWTVWAIYVKISGFTVV